MLTLKTRVSGAKYRLPKSRTKPRKQPVQQRSAETVDVILEAAARVLERDGLVGYNTNAVAKRAGVSIGSLYQYFPGKDAMTVALITRFEERLHAEVGAAVQEAKGKPLKEALRHVIRSLYAEHTRRAALHVVLEAEEQRLAAHIPQGKDSLESMVRSLLVPHREAMRVSLKEAVADCITISLSMVDAALTTGLGSAATERRAVRALYAYLVFED